MIVLGLETSCDETACAVLDGTTVLADEVHSQTAVHAPWGGVVPELASRDHLARVLPVVDRALNRAGRGLAQIDGIAVTAGPGLIGALLVGVQVAKSLALAVGRPIVGVNHLEGHLLAIELSKERVPDFPFLGLLVSGGHTSLYIVELKDGRVRTRALAHTRDDAAGEAFDKVGKLLGLSYPAGPQIDKIATGGDRAAFTFPRAMAKEDDFSFSGLKTSVLTQVKKHGLPEGQALDDLCASFQEAIADSLVTKALRQAERAGLSRLVLCGGVAANSRLRALAAERGAKAGLDVFLPERKLCTDNAAMIAAAGRRPLELGDRAPWNLAADAAWRI